MKKYLVLALAGAAAMTAAPVMAADLNEPIPAAPMAEPVANTAFDWTGAYVGADVGYNWGTAHANRNDRSVDNVIGGVYAGYNYQIDPHWVVGGEADVSYAGSDSYTGGYGDVKIGGNWFGTVRGRAGYAFDNLLLYGTAGLAVAEGNVKLNGDSDSQTHVGYVVGAGVEAALTQNITARAEYLYTDTDEQTYNVAGKGIRTDLDGSSVRVGVGYKF